MRRSRRPALPARTPTPETPTQTINPRDAGQFRPWGGRFRPWGGRNRPARPGGRTRDEHDNAKGSATTPEETPPSPADPGDPGNTLAAQAHRTPPHHPHTFTRKRTKARRLFQLPATFNL